MSPDQIDDFASTSPVGLPKYASKKKKGGFKI